MAQTRPHVRPPPYEVPVRMAQNGQTQNGQTQNGQTQRPSMTVERERQTAVKQRSHIGQKAIKHWSNSGQTLVKQRSNWSNTLMAAWAAPPSPRAARRACRRKIIYIYIYIHGPAVGAGFEHSDHKIAVKQRSNSGQTAVEKL
jgi:hypothetical protein